MASLSKKSPDPEGNGKPDRDAAVLTRSPKSANRKNIGDQKEVGRFSYASYESVLVRERRADRQSGILGRK